MVVRAWRTECGKQCYHVKASQFAYKAFSCLHVGLIVVRINITLLEQKVVWKWRKTPLNKNIYSYNSANSKRIA